MKIKIFTMKALLVFTCFVLGIKGSLIKLEATPDEIIDKLTGTLTLRCSLHDTAASGAIVGRRDTSMTSDNVAEVSAIIVMRNGQDIATISRSTGAVVLDGSRNMHVTGSLSGQVGSEKAYLEITLTDPYNNDTGEYQCDIDTVRGGHSLVFTTKQEINIRDPTMADLIVYMKQGEATLQQQLQQQNQELNQLKDQINTKILFSAGLSKIQNVAVNQTVVYDVIYANIGGSFDPNTGIFQCTVAGQYQFSMSAFLQSNKHGFLIMFHNTTPALAIYGGGNSGSEMLSNSIILTLAKGDVVKVVAYQASEIYNNNRDIYATFTGHLIAMA